MAAHLMRNLRYPLGIGLAWFAAAQLCAVLTTPAQGAYVGLQGTIGSPTNTHNTDRHEASSETLPGLALLLGRRFDTRPWRWLAIEGQLTWQYQRAHGYNPDGADHRQSIDGSYHTLALTVGPSAMVPRDWGWWVRPYATVGVGPALQWRDTTRSSVTGERDDCSACFAPAFRAAVGIERDLTDDLAVRAEGNWLNVGPGDTEQLNAGVALVWRFDGGGS